ncbi:Uncharacterised protein [Agrobacterium tumefaciens]|nr:Uncharacterised protein [Agrobacterium tumefaciens]
MIRDHWCVARSARGPMKTPASRSAKAGRRARRVGRDANAPQALFSAMLMYRENMAGALARPGNGDQLSHCLIRAATWPAPNTFIRSASTVMAM